MVHVNRVVVSVAHLDSPRFTTLYAWPYRFALGMIPQMGVFMCLLMTPEARVVPPPTFLYHHSLHRLLDKSPGGGVFWGHRQWPWVAPWPSPENVDRWEYQCFGIPPNIIYVYNILYMYIYIEYNIYIYTHGFLLDRITVRAK